MKPSLKTCYRLLERAVQEYDTTQSPHARQRALEIVDEMQDCLNDIREELLTNLKEPTTGDLGVQR